MKSNFLSQVRVDLKKLLWLSIDYTTRLMFESSMKKLNSNYDLASWPIARKVVLGAHNCVQKIVHNGQQSVGAMIELLYPFTGGQ